MKRFRLVFLFVLIMMAGITGLVFASASAAQDQGCPAALNGADASRFSTPGSALEVPYNGTVFAQFNGKDTITGHVVKISFGAGLSYTAAEGVDNGTNWSESVDVSKYAKYGVGLYQVTADTSGPGGCTSTAYVSVTGKNPLTTVAGGAAAAAATIGLIGMAGSAVSGVRKGPEMAKLYEQAEMDFGPSPFWPWIGCLVKTPMALLMTGAYMVSGAGGAGAPAAMVVTPYISIVSLLGSLLAGAGTLVLGQQYALFFPTGLFTILWMTGWLAAGIMVSSLARLVAVRKANAILAKRRAPETAPEPDTEGARGGDES